MNCPDCQSILQVINIPIVEKNIKITIVSCLQCGGFLLDSIAVNNLTYSMVEKLAKPNNNNFSTSFVEDKICPSCKGKLKIMREESIPQEVTVFTCDSCFNKWFPSGQLLKFKKAQEIKLAYYKEWKIPLKSIFAILLPIIIIIPLINIIWRLRSGSQPTIYLQENLPSNLPVFFNNLNMSFLEDSQAEITYSTNEDCITILEYGLSQTSLKSLTVDTFVQKTHRVVLSELEKNTRYWFRISTQINGQQAVSPFYVLTTTFDKGE